MTSLAPSNNNDQNEAGTIFQSCPLETTQLSDHHKETKLVTQPSKTIKNKTNQAPQVPPAPPPAWNIGSIATLPDAANIFPLERTRVSLEEDDASPNEIGQKILNSLEDLSISVLSKKRNKLLAESIDRDVRFYIKLYKEKSDNGEYHVMVEIQKRRGCSLSFGHVAHTILQATKSNEHSNLVEEGEEQNERVLPQHLSRQIIQETNYFYTHKTEEEETDPFSFEVQHTADLMQHKQMDVRLLGMQDLVILTNTEVTNHAIALRIAKMVLQNDNDGNDPDLNGLIKNIICESHHDTIDNIWNDGFEQWFSKRMHYYALIVLANSLHVVWSDCLQNEGLAYLQPILTSESWLDEKDGLLFMLTKKLTDTEKRSHEASQVKRCMDVLFQALPPEVSKRAIEFGALRAIHPARNIGHGCQHSLLGHESENAMESSFSALNRPMDQPELGSVECVI